jgi:peptidoglycan-N-acetylglucosamine deacetylase
VEPHDGICCKVKHQPVVQPFAFRKVPGAVKQFFPGIIWDLKTTDRKIFLTFDDGPVEDITPAVLEILQKFGAKATFFCIGRNVERSPELYRSVKDAGHSTGNHTYSHVKGWYMSDKNYYDDIDLASRFIPSVLFRPPYGLITPGQARDLRKNYRIVMWSVLSVDYDPSVRADTSLKHLLAATHEGSVVVFHDSVKAARKMLRILPVFLEHFASLGYIFESLEEV